MLIDRTAHLLIEAIHRAALDPTYWQDVATELDRAVGCGGVAFHAIDEAAGMSVPIGVVGFDPSFLDSYVAYYGSVSPWPEIFPSLPRGKARHSFCDIAEEDYVRTEFYQDWMRPQEDRVASVGIRTTGTGPRSIFATANLRRRDRERLEVPLLHLLDALHMHLSHAAAVNDVIARLSAQTMLALPESELSPLEAGGIVIIDERRLLFWADAGAVALFGSVFRLTPIGRLEFVDATAQDWLEAQTSSIGPAGGASSSTALQTQIRLGARILSIRAIRCDGAVPVLPHFHSGAVIPSRAIALVLSDLSPAQSPAQILQRQFGLSTAEAEVAMRLSAGMDTEEIAAQRGSSRNTVRNQIQSVLTKMGARHRGDVIRIISRLRSEA